MIFEIGFGNSPQKVNIPDDMLAGVLLPNDIEAPGHGAVEAERALNSPINSLKLEELARGKKKVIIVTSDITRPVPSYLLMPLILDRLYAAGVASKNITVVLALGSHRRHTEEERKKLIGERAYSEVKCIDSGGNGYKNMGMTSRGTPVDISVEVADADFRVCIGNIEYHYFAGYSGGVKAIMPGVSTRDAIQANHCRMVEPAAAAGKLDGNPVRDDIEEAGRICRVDFILNVVLDEHKKIIFAVSGHPVDAHRAGCAFLDKLYRKDIPQRFDIVLVSQGGAPKDLNLYQTQKALDNAKHAVRNDGIVILVGSCREGMGEHIFEQWMNEANSPDDLVKRVKEDFQLGGHKAAAIALVLQKAEIYLVSEMDPDKVLDMFMEPFSDVQSALDAARAKLGEKAKVLVMPYGGSTLPVVV